MSEMVTYLGDGAYAKRGSYRGEIIVYTSNGITDENHVYLEPGMTEKLHKFYRETLAGVKPAHEAK